MGSKKFRVPEKPSSHIGVAPDVGQAVANLAAHSLKVFLRRIGQHRLVQVGPEQFDGIQFGSIGREPLHTQPATVLFQPTLREAAAVGGEAIPEQEDSAPAMMPKRLQEAHDVGTADASRMKGQEPAETPGGGCGEHQADPREALPIERLAQAGRLTLGSPSGSNGRSLRESALVQKAQPRLQSSGFFLICGQRTRTQCAIAFSSRSRARRAGRCRLQPKPRRTRQTCRGW